jgi:hypothetical protein
VRPSRSLNSGGDQRPRGPLGGRILTDDEPHLFREEPIDSFEAEIVILDLAWVILDDPRAFHDAPAGGPNQGVVMSNAISHVFYAPVDLPEHVQAYADGLAHHKADYGEVPENAPADLKDLAAQAKKLAPLAAEVHDLELQLAAKRDAYHKAVAPLWQAFSEKLAYAKVFAEKQHKTALLNFLRNYQHHTKGHKAATAAASTPAP